MSAGTIVRARRGNGAPRVRADRETYAVSYDRLSRFRPNEHTPEITVGRDRQYGDAVDYAERHELGGVRERFTDKGSASRFRDRERDDWLRLLDAIKSGRVTHVLVWVLDRIVRDDADRVALINACREGGAVIVQTGAGGTLDPDDEQAVFVATLMGAAAVLEVEKMSKRIRRFKEARREAGLPHGGRRWFGYADASEPGELPAHARNMAVHEVEADIFRDLVARFLGGEALHSLARWLTENNVPTVSGGKWTGPNLRGVIGHPRYAGLLVHDGDVVGAGAWPALIDEATHERVARKLTDPNRRTNKGANARVYLLAGLGVCATCGEPLRGRPMYRPSGEEYGGRAYSCATGRHVHRSVALVDSVVEALVIERLSRTNMAGALVDDDQGDEARTLRAERDAARARLDALADTYADGGFDDVDAYKRATARTRAKLDHFDGKLAELDDRQAAPAAVLDGFLLDDAATREERRAHARAAWDGAELGRRRALVALLFERVALRGGRGPFRPEAVEVDVRAAL